MLKSVASTLLGQVTVYATSGGNPTYYLLKKDRKAISATIGTTTFSFGAPVQFSTVVINSPQIIGILDIVDNNGNTSTCNSTVTVQDNVAPVAVCKNITVQLNSSGTASITASQVDDGSADACGITVLSGPVEATAAGNILMQAIAGRKISSIKKGREIISNSFYIKKYLPTNTEKWKSVYDIIKKI